ncbi:MAG: hypothetical protein N2260_07890 [Syntrophobacterales bacterium]|nr:hypothetical protein [Syntrophobacterales bacterium]
MTEVEKTLLAISEFFDNLKVGYTGHSGYRKTTDLYVLAEACKELIERDLINPNRTVFLDLGAGDGRVNLFMSYLVRYSIGIELEEFIFEEYFIRRNELEKYLIDKNLIPLPENIFILNGNSLSPQTHEELFRKTALTLKEVDIFYTYITLHDAFADLIYKEGKEGALYMVYGFNSVLPRYEGFRLIEANLGLKGLIALYRKEAS